MLVQGSRSARTERWKKKEKKGAALSRWGEDGGEDGGGRYGGLEMEEYVGV